VPHQEVEHVWVARSQLLSGGGGPRGGHVGVKEALRGLGEIFLVVGEGVMPRRPGARLPGGPVEALELPVEGWVDEVEAGEVEGMGELVDSDVLTPVPVICITEHILLCRGAEGDTKGGPEPPGPLVPKAGVKEGVLGQVGGQLAGVPCHEGMAKSLGGHHGGHPGLNVGRHLSQDKSSPLHGLPGGPARGDYVQPCGCGTQLAVVVGVWEVPWVGLHSSDAGGASAPTPDMGGPDWVGVAGGQGDAGPPIADTGACLPSPGDDASTACATGSSALCSGEGVTVGVRGQGGPSLASVTDLLFGKKVGGRNGLRHGNLFLDMIFFIFLKYKIKIKKKIGPTVMHCFKIRC